MARTWVPYDQMVTADERPGEEYVEWPDQPPISVTGPDADGLVWLRADVGSLHGAVSVRADSIAGRAFLALRDPNTVAASTQPADATGTVEEGFMKSASAVGAFLDGEAGRKEGNEE